MLKRFIANRLSHYVHGLGSDQVSARLLSGKLSLSDVDVNLEAVADLLVGLLPHTLELCKVACKTVSAKVPWKAPRRNPICVELRGVEVEVVVHGPFDEAWLAAQTSAQRRQLERIANRSAVETLRDEDEEDQKQLRDVEAQLKVGLQNVVADGLRVSVSDIRIVLRQALPPSEPPGPAFALRVGSLTAVPCNRSGVLVDRPQDVYDVADGCVRVYRLVEVQGFRVEALASDAADIEAPAQGAGTSQPTAPTSPPPTSPLAEHADELGCIRVWVQQQRLAGFLRKHRALRVCPYSSEAVVGVQLGTVRVRASEVDLSTLISTVIDALAPPYVQLEALPPSLAHLHWRWAAAAATGSGGGAGRGSAASLAPSCPATPTLAPAPSPRYTTPPGKGTTSAAASPATAAGAAAPAVAAAAVAAATAAGAGGPRGGTSDGMSWSEPVLAVEAALGLEAREHRIERRLVRLAALRLKLRAVTFAISAEERPGAVGTSFCLLGGVKEMSFARDDVFVLNPFERRCLVELGFAESRGTLASAAAAVQAEAGATPTTHAAAADAAAALAASSPSLAEVEAARHAAAERLQRAARGHLARRRLRELRESSGSGAAAALAAPSSEGCAKGRTANSGSGSGAVLSEPTARQPTMSVNAFALSTLALRWRPGLIDLEDAPEFPLLDLEAPTGGPAVTFRWKELQVQPKPAKMGAAATAASAGASSDDSGSQPMEGCVHGVALTVDVDGLRRLGSFSKRVGTALDGFSPPPFETGWMRFALHDITLKATPRPLGPHGSLQMPGVVVEVPALLVTSLLGLGELFCGLGSVPARADWHMPSGVPAAAATVGVSGSGRPPFGGEEADTPPTAAPTPSPRVGDTPFFGTPRASTPPLTDRDGAAVGDGVSDGGGGGASGGGGMNGAVAVGRANAEDAAAAADATLPRRALEASADPFGTVVAAPPGQMPGGDMERVQDALRAARASACPCGRLVADGAVRLGAGFVPARVRHTSRAWAMRQRAAVGTPMGSGFVAVRREELVDLLRARVSAESLAAVMPRLRELWDDGGADDGGTLELEESPRKTTKGSSGSGGKKRGLGGRRSSSSSQVVGGASPTSAAAASAEASGGAAKLATASPLGVGSPQDIAMRWASLLETLRRLRAEREEVNLRCAALRASAGAEVGRVEARGADRERDLAAQISHERLRQAELAARAEEQQKALDKLMRVLPPSAVIGGIGSSASKLAAIP